MAMTVTRVKDTKTPRVFMHKIADVRGGVSVNVSELTQDYLPEGTILSVPVSGVSHVIKTAVLQANAHFFGLRPKTGGTSAMKKNVISFCIALGLHFFGLRPKIGGTSAMKKNVISFCIALGFLSCTE